MPDGAPARLEVLALPGIGEVAGGTHLAAVIAQSLRHSGLQAAEGDVLVVSSKVVSKALRLLTRDPRDDVVAQQTVRTVAARRTPRGTASIVESAAGPVMAAAGVDASNTSPGTVLTLPPDADEVARGLRRDLRALGLPLLAVVISDTAGRPWRTGQTDFALGVAGLAPLDDLRGTRDSAGQVLEVTERAVADELAAAADLVKGKASGTPVALVRGFGDYVTEADGPGAKALLRAARDDWFRYGHVEAAWQALGVPADAVEPRSVMPEALRDKLFRVARIVIDGSGVDVGSSAGESSGTVTLTGAAFACGVAVQRLRTAAWAEDLVVASVSCTTGPDGTTTATADIRLA